VFLFEKHEDKTLISILLFAFYIGAIKIWNNTNSVHLYTNHVITYRYLIFQVLSSLCWSRQKPDEIRSAKIEHSDTDVEYIAVYKW